MNYAVVAVTFIHVVICFFSLLLCCFKVVRQPIWPVHSVAWDRRRFLDRAAPIRILSKGNHDCGGFVHDHGSLIGHHVSKARRYDRWQRAG